jgi:2-oxoisovalerate dehydrogenase E2 component (dihydrolipoyl transacylase)
VPSGGGIRGGQTHSQSPNGAAAPSTAHDRRADAAASRPSGTTPDVAELTAAAPVAARPPSRECRPAAAPTVRARARAIGVDLGVVAGTGPDGRITHSDLDAYLMSTRPSASARSTVPTGDDTVEDVKVTGLRRNIAERMQASKRRIPHFTYVEEVDVTEIERLRHELNDAKSEQQPRLSLLPFLMRAVVAAVRAHPAMNARFDDEERVVRRHRAVHLGIAVQTDRGLMVPVVKHASDLDIWASAVEVAASLRRLARQRSRSTSSADRRSRSPASACSEASRRRRSSTHRRSPSSG